MSETHTRILKQDLEALKEIQQTTGSLSISSTLHSILTSKEPIQKALTLVQLRLEDYQQLQTIMQDVGYSDIGCVIHAVLQSQATTEMISFQKVMTENVPVLLTGKPLSGKSYWVKNAFIPTLSENLLLVVDTNNEYDFLREVKSIRDLDIQSHEKVRFVPAQHSVMSNMMVKGLFTELNMMLDINKDSLRNLVLIVEEAQSFKGSWFNAFLYRSRHCVRKMLILTPDDCYKNLQTFTVFR